MSVFLLYYVWLSDDTFRLANETLAGVFEDKFAAESEGKRLMAQSPKMILDFVVIPHEVRK